MWDLSNSDATVLINALWRSQADREHMNEESSTRDKFTVVESITLSLPTGAPSCIGINRRLNIWSQQGSASRDATAHHGIFDGEWIGMACFELRDRSYTRSYRKGSENAGLAHRPSSTEFRNGAV